MSDCIINGQNLTSAYNAGCAAYKAGNPEPPKNFSWTYEGEFRRGYVMARKHDRHQKTWAAKRKAKGLVEGGAR